MYLKTIIIYSALATLAVFGWAEGRAADVTLQFDPVSGAESYRIEMSADMGAWYDHRLLPPNAPSGAGIYK